MLWLEVPPYFLLTSTLCEGLVQLVYANCFVLCCSYDTIISLLIVACERLVYVNCFYVLWHKRIISRLHTVVSLLTVACERLVHLVYANCLYVLQRKLINIISHNQTVILLLVACERLVYPVFTNNCHNVQPFRITDLFISEFNVDRVHVRY